MQETIDNSDGSHTIYALKSGQTLTSIANDLFIGGGNSSETFVLQPIFGHDTIADFYAHMTGAGHDTISLSLADFTSFASVLGAAHDVGADCVIVAASGNQLTLSNLHVATLASLSSDVVFHS